MLTAGCERRCVEGVVLYESVSPSLRGGYRGEVAGTDSFEGARCGDVSLFFLFLSPVAERATGDIDDVGNRSCGFGTSLDENSMTPRRLDCGVGNREIIYLVGNQTVKEHSVTVGTGWLHCCFGYGAVAYGYRSTESETD